MRESGTPEIPPRHRPELPAVRNDPRIHAEQSVRRDFLGDRIKKVREVIYQEAGHETAACKVTTTLTALMNQGYWTKSVTEVLQKLLYSCVQKREKMPKLDYESKKTGSDADMRAALDTVLEKKKPAEVTICSEILDGTDNSSGVKGWNNWLNRGFPGNLKNCSSHALLSVGRRKVGGKCEYLLRNSWGGAWGEETNRDCACKTPSGIYYPDCRVLAKKYETVLTDRVNRSMAGKKVVTTNVCRSKTTTRVG